MTKKYIVNPENPNGILVDLTAEEENQIILDQASASEQKDLVDAEKTKYKVDRDSLIAKLKDVVNLSDDEISVLLDNTNSSIFTEENK